MYSFQKMDKSREVLYYESLILKSKFFYIECIATTVNFDQPFYPCTYVEQVPLGTHIIPKLTFYIDKSAYYKGILAFFLEIDFCIFSYQNTENPT
jgi:hypothetical protein